MAATDLERLVVTLEAQSSKLDKTISDVCATMKAETRKSRVTFYYLIAEKTGKLSSLAG